MTGYCQQCGSPTDTGFNCPRGCASAAAVPATDKLPEWLESWLDENSIHPFAGSSFRAVSTYDLRAFLAQFVLCEREPVAHAVVAPDGNIRMWHRSQFEATPLHAPATGLTETSTTQEQTR